MSISKRYFFFSKSQCNQNFFFFSFFFNFTSITKMLENFLHSRTWYSSPLTWNILGRKCSIWKKGKKSSISESVIPLTYDAFIFQKKLWLFFFKVMDLARSFLLSASVHMNKMKNRFSSNSFWAVTHCFLSSDLRLLGDGSYY